MGGATGRESQAHLHSVSRFRMLLQTLSRGDETGDSSAGWESPHPRAGTLQLLPGGSERPFPLPESRVHTSPCAIGFPGGRRGLTHTSMRAARAVNSHQRPPPKEVLQEGQGGQDAKSIDCLICFHAGRPGAFSTTFLSHGWGDQGRFLAMRRPYLGRTLPHAPGGGGGSAASRAPTQQRTIPRVTTKKVLGRGQCPLWGDALPQLRPPEAG